MIKAVLFDMDGVLIDAKDWHYEALNRALDLFGMACQRRSKNRPRGGAKVGHLGAGPETAGRA
ncbi:hypothetical protein [Shinella zoogloeoides]|uniref:hypothetical protein n=1 Tax=Shinella zoogloeoides TaxID=352475 RepID=UPI001F5734F7|nr:hypothetical protein [Shinella zoogloeoides]